MKIFIIMFGILIFSGNKVLAVDLVNNDNTSYTVRVTADNDFMELKIAPFAAQEKICQSSCTIQVLTVEDIKVKKDKFDARNGDSIAIQGGVLVRE
jgi:hypothetical protein